MREHVTRRPIPVDQSILWKPLYDSHYVVASLQPTNGGRQTIFIRQQALGRAQKLAAMHGRRAIGLLVGHLYQCPTTGTDYLVVDSVADRPPVLGDDELEAAIAEAFADAAAQNLYHGFGASDHRPHFLGSDNRPHVLGWFRGVASVEPKPSTWTSSAHTSLFKQPWQLTLVLGEAGGSGAIYLRDAANARWFTAPFYELLEHPPRTDAPKPTMVEWAQYITAEPVALTSPDETPVVELADVRSRKRAAQSPIPLTSRLEIDGGSAMEALSVPIDPIPIAIDPLAIDHADSGTVASSSEVTASPAGDSPANSTALPKVSEPFADRPAPRAASEGLADLPRSIREKPAPAPAPRRSGRWLDKLSIVDDRDQRSEVPSLGRPLRDDDDTTSGDAPAHYLDVARAEGFFIAGQFNAVSDLTPLETLWILNEPYSGLLLTAVTTASEVIDATLHYNLQTDDAGVQRTPFADHRDAESKIVYVRETAVESLRARCNRLRATGALIREWRVTPPMSLLTPTEWECIPTYQGGTAGAGAIADLTNARIAELPEGIREQFHLGTGLGA